MQYTGSNFEVLSKAGLYEAAEAAVRGAPRPGRPRSGSGVGVAAGHHEGPSDQLVRR